MKITHLLFTIILAIAFGSIQASGQRSSTKPKVTPQSSSSTGSKVRARRANGTDAPKASEAVNPTTTVPVTEAHPGIDKPATTADPTETANPADAKSGAIKSPGPDTTNSAQSVTAVGEDTNKPPADPILALRDQIDAATTSQERVELQLQLVDLLVAGGKKPEALAELNRVTASDEFNPQGLYNTGNAFARLGDNDGAVVAYRKAIEQRKGKYSRALNNLGVVLLRAGRWEEAYEALTSALRLENFHYAEASYNLGRLYAARGDNDLAVREWQRVLKIDPNHTAAAREIADLGNEGRVVVEARTAKPPRLPEPRNADKPSSASHPVTPKSVKTTSATAAAPKVLSVDQTSYEFLQRARSSSERGNPNDAVDNYLRLLKRQGGYFPPANLELSYLLIGLKRYDEAQANLLQVTNRDGSRYPISYFHLARLYELKGELKLAESAFSQTVAAYGGKNVQFLLDLSRVREKQGDFKGALEAMEQYLTAMKNQGQEPAWSNDRLSALRQKLSTVVP